MKPLIGVIIAVLLCGGIYKCTYSDAYRKVMYPNEYASTNVPEYKESEVNKLKRELDDQRLKSLRLQAKLDSCRYFVDDFKEIKIESYTYTPPKKAKKKSKALEDCTNELVALKAQLGECVVAKAQMEVEKDLQINLLKRQMDTCAYFVQEMDKALLKISNDVTKLTNEKDSLTNILQTPIAINKDFPCLKAKRGVSVVASVIPNTGKQDFIVNAFTLEKKVYKASKKSCKRTTR